METAFGIFIIVVAFGIFFGNSGLSEKQLKILATTLDKSISKEFDKRDKKIEELEKQVKELKGK